MADPDQDERLLRPGEVARRFGVDARTVSQWADKGALTTRTTKGGHRRIVDDARARAADDDEHA